MNDDAISTLYDNLVRQMTRNLETMDDEEVDAAEIARVALNSVWDYVLRLHRVVQDVPELARLYSIETAARAIFEGNTFDAPEQLERLREAILGPVPDEVISAVNEALEETPTEATEALDPVQQYILASDDAGKLTIHFGAANPVSAVPDNF